MVFCPPQAQANYNNTNVTLGVWAVNVFLRLQVIHGWFTDPQPFFTGGLSAEGATEPLNDALDNVYPALEDVGRVTGVLTVRLHVSAKTGEILNIAALTDTLIPDPNDLGSVDEDVRADVLAAIQKGLAGARFPVAGDDSFITVPFIFE